MRNEGMIRIKKERDESQQAEEIEGGVEVLRDPDVYGGRSGDDEGKQNCEYADASLQVGVELERFSVSVNNPAKTETAQRQSGHEGCQYRGRGKRGAAKHEHEHPVPDHFVDQSGGTGKEEEDQDRGLKTTRACQCPVLNDRRP